MIHYPPPILSGAACANILIEVCYWICHISQPHQQNRYGFLSQATLGTSLNQQQPWQWNSSQMGRECRRFRSLHRFRHCTGRLVLSSRNMVRVCQFARGLLRMYTPIWTEKHLVIITMSCTDSKTAGSDFQCAALSYHIFFLRFHQDTAVMLIC